MKKRNLTRILSIILTLCLFLVTIPAAALAANELDGKTVILYSANLRGSIGVLPQMAALKASYTAKGAEVVLADAGNFLQGSVYATYDSGKTVIELMDKAGYDIVALGSHEFDFGNGQVGVEQHEVFYADDTLGKLLEDASFTAVSANIMTGGNTINAFAPSAAFTTKSGFEIGFFGLTDPNTVNAVLEASLSGLTFQSGAAVAAKQATALAECDVVVGLSNLGSMPELDGTIMVDIGSDAGFTAGALIIDNKTGAVLSNDAVSLTGVSQDATVKAAVDAAKAVIDAEYPANAIAKSLVTLNGSMTANRSVETNTGNLWTDALLWFATEGGIESFYDEDEIANGNTGIQVDAAHTVAVWNGGNLRDYLNSGDVTMKDIQRVLPYPNRVAVVYLTGAQLTELLEAASQGLPYNSVTSAACASFMQVSGIKYTISAGVPFDAGEAYGNNWFKASSIQRVTIDSINGAAFDKAATYAVITSNAVANGMDSNYICLDKDADLSTITTATVVDVVWSYINQKLDGVIGSKYAAAHGRITVDNSVNYADEKVVSGVLMRQAGIDTSSPDTGITRAQLVAMLYITAGSPAAGSTHTFVDVAGDASYANAVAWAAGKGITSGTTATTFSPDSIVTRQELAVFLHNYCGKPEARELSITDVADWAKAGVAFCDENGYIELTGNTFNARAAASRAVAAKAIAGIHAN